MHVGDLRHGDAGAVQQVDAGRVAHPDPLPHGPRVAGLGRHGRGSAANPEVVRSQLVDQAALTLRELLGRVLENLRELRRA